MTNNLKKIALAVSVLALSACSLNLLGDRNDSKPLPAPIAQRDGEVVVKFRSNATDAEIASVLAQYKSSSIVDKADRIYLVTDAELTGKEATQASKLEAQSVVEFAEPNFIVKINQTMAAQPPQDPMWLSLWGMKNYGQDAPNGVEGVEGADIGAMDAWQVTTGSKDVLVAVLDTGIDYNHPDLAENVWVNAKEKAGVPGVDDDGNGYVDDLHGWDAISDARKEPWYGQVGDPDPMDDNSHGTHVAGTIGARGGNGVGVVGVNWNVSIMAVKFLDANGSGSSVDEYRALKYIIANKPDVVNGSYGGGAPSKLIASILDDARSKGILFVFAAGNESSDNDLMPAFPASYPHDNIISVAATDSRDQIADFSNYGR
ncbi:MAG: S8 family serine peptidase, partial [Bdellovibrionota bacterium]